MKPAICLLTHNRPDYTQQSLESVLNTKHPYELYIYDNGSDKEVREFFAHELFKDVKAKKIFGKENLGLTAAMNWMMRLAVEDGCDLYCHIANDIIVPPGWLEYTVKAVEAVPNLGPVGLNLEYKDFPVKTINGIELEEIELEGCIGGMHFCIPKKLFDAAGYFRYEFFYGQQDATYTYKARCLDFMPMYIPKKDFQGEHLGVFNIFDIDDKGYCNQIGVKEKYVEYHNEMQKIIQESGARGRYMRWNYKKVYNWYKEKKVTEEQFREYFRNVKQVRPIKYEEVYADITNIKW